MKFHSCAAAIIAAFVLAPANTQAAVVLSEDFEDAAVAYTLSSPEASDGGFDFFGRVGPTGISANAGAIGFGNLQGTGFFGAMDIDATPEPNIADGNATILWSGLNIAGETGLIFSGLFAEDDDGANQDWDDDTSVVVQYQIDGGGFTNLLAIEADPSDNFNTAPRLDTNFDGDGDGTEITSDFTEFSANIAGTGNSLDLRIVLSAFDSGDEDIAFDNISIISATAIPEPTSALLLCGLGLGLVVRRRRRS